MPLKPAREIFITAAVTGAGATTHRSNKVPITPRQIADAAIESAEAGAAVAHIHVRDPETVNHRVSWSFSARLWTTSGRPVSISC